jgi:hypothetical protein
LFRIVVLNNNYDDENALNFLNIVHSPLNGLVHHVVISTAKYPDWAMWQDDGQTEAEIEESFDEAMGLLPQLRNLDTVELEFSDECAGPPSEPSHSSKDVTETQHFREGILRIMFQALADQETVKSLTISNLQDHMTEEIFESDAFKAVRERLTKLHLLITSEEDFEQGNSIDFPSCHQGFRHSLPNFWLKPMTTQLTHLTLHGSVCVWGFWPFVDLRDIAPFPHLRSLSLGTFAIAHDWQVDWIISHGPTLQELRLDDCSIVFACRMEQDQAHTNFPGLCSIPGRDDYFKEVDLRWHRVLERFEKELPHLGYFATGIGGGDEAFDERYDFDCAILSSGYTHFDCGIGRSQFFEGVDRYRQGGCFDANPPDVGIDKDWLVIYPQCELEDREALGSLLETMRQRKTRTMQR